MDKNSEQNPIVAATEAIREKIRIYSRDKREQKRGSEIDALRFGLGEIQKKITDLENITEKDVQGLANRIKRRRGATADDMYRLSHAFLQSIENIRTFAKTTGAIQVIVKELIRQDSEQRCHAIDTLCNLSLGEAPVCKKIASEAGCYLITYLSSLDERLKRVSLWTLANIMACGGNGAHIMVSMEIVPTVLDIYLSDNDEPDYRHDAALVLDIITSSAENFLRPIDREALFESFHLKNPTTEAAEYHLRIIFNSEIIAPGVQLTEEQVSYLMNVSVSNITKTSDFETAASRMKIVYAVRMIANLVALDPACFNVLIEKCRVWNTNLVQMLNKLFAFKNPDLGEQALWLVKNIEACQSANFPASDFVQHLVIPEGSVPPLQTSVSDLEVDC